MVSKEKFKSDLPEFTDAVKFPAGVIDYWLQIAGLMLNTKRWGASAADPWPAQNLAQPKLTIYDFGCEQFVAHNLALEAKGIAMAAAGGIPGFGVGVISSKSIDGVSVSYDVKAGIEQNAGHWGMTVYGNRFLRMLRQMGTGPYQIGAPGFC